MYSEGLSGNVHHIVRMMLSIQHIDCRRYISRRSPCPEFAVALVCDTQGISLPAEDSADEAANAYEMCPHPFPVACDDTLCDLIHKADIVIEQASMAGIVRSHRSVCIEVQCLDDRRR